MKNRCSKYMALFAAVFLSLSVPGCAKKAVMPAAKPAHRQVLAVLSDDLEAVNQSSTIAQIDLTEEKLVKTLGGSSIGHSAEACVSPDRKKMAFNRWADNRMDCPLWVSDLSTGRETLLTPGDINGEIHRISWLDNDRVLYCFGSHKHGRHANGDDLYCCNVRTGERKSVGGINTDNHYNTVRYDKSRKKILLAKCLYEVFCKTPHQYPNALYECNADGSGERKLFDSGSGTIGRVVEIPDTRDLAVEIYGMGKDQRETSDIYRYEDKTGKLTKLLDHNTGHGGRMVSEFNNICATDRENLLFTFGRSCFNMNLSTKKVEVLSISGVSGMEYKRLDNY